MLASEDTPGMMDDSDSDESLAESLDESLDESLETESDVLSLSDNDSSSAVDSSDGDLVESATDGTGMEDDSFGMTEELDTTESAEDPAEDDMLAELLEERLPAKRTPGIGSVPIHLRLSSRHRCLTDLYRRSESYSRNDVAAKIAAARRLHEAFDQAWLVGGKSQEEIASVREAARDFYVAFAELAEQATLVDREGAEEVLAESEGCSMSLH